MNIENFLKELRISSDSIYNIFTKGSCFHLYLIIKTFESKAIPYWSDVDNHCIIKIDNSFYDIGGKVNNRYVEDKGYYMVPDSLIEGYSLLKYTKSDEDKNTVTVEKYRNE